MKTPIDMMLDGVKWVAIEHGEMPSGAVYATHEAVLDFAGHKLRVYQLNTGQRVINQDDFEAFFSGMQG